MYTEIVKIIEGGLVNDKEKVINYAEVLIPKHSANGRRKENEKRINRKKNRNDTNF